MHFFVMIRISNKDPRSLKSWCLRGTDKSMSRVDSSFLYEHHDLSDLRSLIVMQIIPKKHTIVFFYHFFLANSIQIPLLYFVFLIFGDVFNETIIPLSLVGYEMIIANSYPTRLLGYYLLSHIQRALVE